MATSLLYVCKCKRQLQVYIPKVKQYAWAGLDDLMAEAVAADAEEQERGEVAPMAKLAADLGAGFVDGSQSDVWLCPGCGFDVGAALERVFADHDWSETQKQDGVPSPEDGILPF